MVLEPIPPGRGGAVVMACGLLRRFARKKNAKSVIFSPAPKIYFQLATPLPL